MTREFEVLVQLIQKASLYKDKGDFEVEFYWNKLVKQGLLEQDLQWTIEKLGVMGIIQKRKLQYEEEEPRPTRSRLLNPTYTHPLAVWTLTINRNNFNKLLEIDKPKYSISINKKREVLLNGKYIISNPNFMSENCEFITYAIKHPNTIITKEALKSEKIATKKRFTAIVAGLVFTGELQKAFFPNISKTSIEFRNNLTDADLQDLQVDEEKLKKQISKLEKVVNKKT